MPDATVGIVCYGYDGLSYANQTQCPFSNACCDYKATCLSNRLCHNPDDGDEYIRGPCMDNPWDTTCAQICLYNETENGNLFPRVTQCSDGSFCCDNNANCCQDGLGVFLDTYGSTANASASTTISYPPVSGTGTERYTYSESTSTSSILIDSISLDSVSLVSVSSTSVSTTSVPTTSVPTASMTIASLVTSVTILLPTTLAPTGTNTVVQSSSAAINNQGLKLGLAIGISIVILLFLGGIWVFLRRRKSRDSEIKPVDGLDDKSTQILPPEPAKLPQYTGPSELESEWKRPAELHSEWKRPAELHSEWKRIAELQSEWKQPAESWEYTRPSELRSEWRRPAELSEYTRPSELQSEWKKSTRLSKYTRPWELQSEWKTMHAVRDISLVSNNTTKSLNDNRFELP